MVIKSGMFNSVNRDRVYKAEDWAAYFAMFIGNGVFPNPSTGLKVIADVGMNIILKPGNGWINGYYLTNTSDYTLKLDVADAVLKRVDRVVMRLNHLDREIEIAVKKGTYASSPVAPPVDRNADVYELALADILVANGVVSIIQGVITDQRLNNAVCGIVHTTVDQVDTTDIFNQYQSWFNDYSSVKADEFLAWQTRVTSDLETWISTETTDFEAWLLAKQNEYLAWFNNRANEFDTWFATIVDILDTNAAGNLQIQIDNHKKARLPHRQFDEVTGLWYDTGWVIINGELYFEYVEATE